MKSRSFLLLAALLVGAAALWAFLPTLGAYDGANEAPFEITKAELERDHSDYWLTLTLKGDLPDRVDPEFGLVTPEGKLIRGVQADGLSLPTRFWINAKDLKQPLQLRLQGQTLQVKKNGDLPEIENQATSVFYKSTWK